MASSCFLCSPNVLREYVVQVTDQSKGHLCKVTDIEELFRRISTVIFSNDPMARALTLRLVLAIELLVCGVCTAVLVYVSGGCSRILCIVETNISR